jgi:hypothetical protein
MPFFLYLESVPAFGQLMSNISELPPASIRATVRRDKNPWAAVQGDPLQVRKPVFWLWPYWMARYMDIIKSD